MRLKDFTAKEIFAAIAVIAAIVIILAAWNG